MAKFPAIFFARGSLEMLFFAKFCIFLVEMKAQNNDY